jgi:uncharacterized protein (TIGR02246 family)
MERTTMKQMNRKLILPCFVLVCASAGLAQSAQAQARPPIRHEPLLEAGPQSGNGAAATATTPPASRPEDEKAIKQITDLFVQAFNAGDAKGVASLYTSDAELIDEYGDHIDGRPTIESFYSALFAARKGATIDVSPTSLRFLGPEVAKESGQTCVKGTGGEPASYRDYTVVYIKHDGRWLHSSVREEFPANLAHHERLKELEWTIGEWLDESSESIIHANCRWSDDQNFLLRDFEIHAQGKPVMKVNERIGWDPVAKQIKSWVFDSTGGYGHGYWARNGNRWVIKSTGVLADGRTATATNVLTRTGLNSARWHSIDRTVGGEIAPDHSEAVMVRRPPSPQPR